MMFDLFPKWAVRLFWTIVAIALIAVLYGILWVLKLIP